MKRLLVALTLFLALAAPASSFEWGTLAKQVERSLFPIANERGQIYCTAFVIDDKRDLMMTADHCTDNGAIVIDRKNAWEVYGDPALDIAVLQVPGIKGKALKPHPGEPFRGQSVAAFGYGYGLPEGMFRSGEISHPNVFIDFGDDHNIMTNFTLIGGMSGGPMVDTEGRIVAVNQRGNQDVALGKNIRVIYPATQEFWEE